MQSVILLLDLLESKSDHEIIFYDKLGGTAEALVFVPLDDVLAFFIVLF